MTIKRAIKKMGADNAATKDYLLELEATSIPS